MNVFISYRRGDSATSALLLRNALAQRFGDDAVFMDIEDIPYGGDFINAIDAHLAACDAVVAVIGPRWLATLLERADAEDYVRHELVQALALGKRVVPVLVGGAAPPGDALPDALAPLRSRNMLALDERFLLPLINALLETLRGETFENAERRHERDKRRARTAWLAGVATALAMFFAVWTALFDQFFGIDARVATLTMWLGRPDGQGRWGGQVVLAGIDPVSERQLGRPFDPGWRREHARLIERAARAGARAVAFDLFFDQPGADADDAALEAALRSARQAGVAVVLGVDAPMRGDAPALLPRFAALAAWGIACAGERHGAARTMVLAVERPAAAATAASVPGAASGASGKVAPRLLPSLALAAFSGGGRVESLDTAARLVRVRLPRDEVSVDVDYSYLDALQGEQDGCPALAPGDRVATQLFDAAALPALDAPPRRLAYAALLAQSDAALRETLAGRILLVGPQLPGRDRKEVAGVPDGGERFGVELIAAQLDALLRRRADPAGTSRVVRPLGALGDFLTLLGAGLAGAAGRRTAAPWSAPRRWLLAAGLALGFVALSALLYRWRQLLPAVPYGLGAMALAWWATQRLEGGWPWRGIPRERNIP